MNTPVSADHPVRAVVPRLLGALALQLLVFDLAAAGEIPFAARSTIGTIGANAIVVFVAADLDGDGDMDVVASKQNPDLLVWYENNGATPPAWTERTIRATGSSPQSIGVADVDGDGDLDVVSYTYGNVEWTENKGGSPPAWTVRTIGSTTGGGSGSIVAVDLNGDGDLDVICASINSHKLVWFENGGQSPPGWTERTISTTGERDNVSAVDVDGDGDLDVVSRRDGNSIVWNANDGAWTERTIMTNTDGILSAAVADIDNDGDMDVLESDEVSPGGVHWCENDGASVPGWTVRAVGAGAVQRISLQAADLDGDGDLDVLAQELWYENDGASPPGWILHSVTLDAVYAASAADLDGDGDLDVLAWSGFLDQVMWYENRTIHRNAVFPAQSTISTAADFAQSIDAADVDGDGDMDLLSASSNDDKIAWYENNGASPPVFTPRTIATTADFAASVHAADIDGDGDTDVLSASRTDDKIAWYENNGARPPVWTAHTISTLADGAVSVFPADLDGDGDLDVLSASIFGDQVTWYENNGARPPVWTARTISTTADGASSVFAADIDGDGHLDVLSASQLDDKVTWYQNNGLRPPSFTAHPVGTADGATGVFAADLDHDGDIDVLSASQLDNTIAWYENIGGSPPTFVPHTISTTAMSARSVVARDLDGDGDLDVVSASAGDDRIAWYENDGARPPSFTAHTISALADGAVAVVAADIDGDGDVDVASASLNDDRIAWYANRGGQFGITTTNTAPAKVVGGQVYPILTMTLTNNGRAGDTGLHWASAQFRLEEALGDPLTTSEANGLFVAVDLYRDDGSGQFSPADDRVGAVPLNTLVAGEGQIAMSNNVFAQVAPGTSGTFFLVAYMESSIATPPTFRITHLQSSSQVEDQAKLLSVQPEYLTATEVSSSLVTVGIGAGSVPDGQFVLGTPLRVDKAPTAGNLTLSWGPSCHAGDNDYAVYEGALGSFYSHLPTLCTTGGATGVSVTPGSGNRYYLIVPLSPDGAEGSYGRSSTGERPHRSSACWPQDIESCS